MMMSWIAVKGDPIDWFKVWDAVGSSIDVFIECYSVATWSVRFKSFPSPQIRSMNHINPRPL